MSPRRKSAEATRRFSFNSPCRCNPTDGALPCVEQEKLAYEIGRAYTKAKTEGQPGWDEFRAATRSFYEHAAQVVR